MNDAGSLPQDPVPSGLPGPSPLASWAQAAERLAAEELLIGAARRFRRLAIVTSFQASGSVMIDLADRLKLGLRVITLDTGRLPEETYLQIDRVRDRYGVEVEIRAPDADGVAALVAGKGPNLFLESREDRLACCFVRKVEPFRHAVAGLDAWISGARREQSAERRVLRKVQVETRAGLELAAELDGERRRRLQHQEEGRPLVKISPLADWSEQRVWDYLREHRVPYHPLYDRGYRSIGCAPCTRPARPAEAQRGSRWWWEQGPKECGLHQIAGSSR